MTIHYTIEKDQVACGRNDHRTTATKLRDFVTCKSCLRSPKFRAATQAPAPASEPSSKPYNWRFRWAVDAINKRPKDRLPRGFKRPLLPLCPGIIDEMPYFLPQDGAPA